MTKKASSSDKRMVDDKPDLHKLLLHVRDTGEEIHIIHPGKCGEINRFYPGQYGDITLILQRYKGKGKGQPWVLMRFAIDDETRLDAIKYHWPTIQKYRDDICKFQGPAILSDRTIYLHELHQANVHEKKGYGSLAKDVNREIEDLLTAYKDDNDEEYGFRESMNIMMVFGINEKSARAYCEDALRDIRSGKNPIWARGGNPYTEPISLDQVRKRLEWYRKRYTSPPPKRGTSP